MYQKNLPTKILRRHTKANTNMNINHRKLGSDVNHLISLVIIFVVYTQTGFTMPYLYILGVISYPITGMLLRAVRVWNY